MSIVVRFNPTNVDRAKYDETMWKRPVRGPIRQVASSMLLPERRTTSKVSEIWASREQFQAQAESLMPVLTDLGIEFSGEPEVFEVQNLVK